MRTRTRSTRSSSKSATSPLDRKAQRRKATGEKKRETRATSKSTTPSPADARIVSSNLYNLLGARRGIESLLDSCDPEDTRASALRDLLSSYDVDGSSERRAHDRAMTFDLMYAKAGYTAKDIYDIFRSRKDAVALVVATASKPQVVAELIEDVLKKLVPCLNCGGSKKQEVRDDEDTVIGYVECHRCDPEGMMLIEGDAKARELYFDQFGFKTSGPMVAIDNRSVKFEVGGMGTAPAMTSTIQALERVKDVGPRMLPAGSESPIDTPVRDAEVV